MRSDLPGLSQDVKEMLRRMRSAARSSSRAAGGGPEGQDSAPEDMILASPGFAGVAAQVRPYTMTSFDKQYALYGAVQHVLAAGIAGDIVECGVWRGGSSMLAALALQQAGDSGRPLWMYDTFEGMPPPTDKDVDRSGIQAAELLAQSERIAGVDNPWAYATLDDVRANMARTGYAPVRYVAGKVEDTIPGEIPEQISLLRLDTDWYESTRHELQHLYPRLQSGGVLIVDDYGWYDGARRAVDEFFAGHPLFLVRIGIEGARIAVKP